MPYQRVGPVAALPELLAELGVPIEAALEGSGIAPHQLVQDARFPFHVIVSILERSASLADCPDLGLRLGARQEFAWLGAMGQMMRRAPTLGDALRDYVGLQIGYSRGAVVYLHRMGDDYAIGYGIYQPAMVFGRQVYDLVAALGCNMIRGLTAGRAKPIMVLMSCAPPENPGRYARTLKCPVLFDQEQTCVVFSAADMNLPLPDADPAERSRLRSAIQQMVGSDLDDVAARVRHALRPRLMIGEAHRDLVAHDLGLHARTMSRRLALVGNPFETIKDEVRFVVARELLALTRLQIGNVAGVLSYATNSSFDRAFRRWSGESPSAWRARETAPFAPGPG